MPPSRAKVGDIYLDKQLLKVVERNNFEKVSDRMVALVNGIKITELVEILQNNRSCAVSLNSAQFRDIEKSNHRYCTINFILAFI